MENMEKKTKKIIIPKPIVLIVLDGWGVNQNYAGNAIASANTSFYDSLLSEYPATALLASGEAVGLPWSENGNSEVGHLNLGLGRILYQDLSRINKEISDRSFYYNRTLIDGLKHAKDSGGNLHLIGMISNGGVHSSVDHLYALLELAKKYNFEKVFVHAILDGRDTAYNSGKNCVKELEYKINKIGVGKIATVSGRYYAMDRNNNWDRTEKAYRAMTAGKGERSPNALTAVDDSYSKKIFDEEFIPTVIAEKEENPAIIADGDSVVFFNYRPDRARQLTKAFVLPDFKGFERRLLADLSFICFTEYEKGLPVKIVFPPFTIKKTLGEILADKGLKQLRIAETEKYAHVTYFFNGGREKKSPGEDHILVPSPAVSSYDQKPEMSAQEITKKLIERVDEDVYDFILVNFANCDMVGHTGNIEAAIKGIETIDKCLEKLIPAILKQDGLALITADHGNAEVMYNMQMGRMDKEHTANPVPFIVVGNHYAGKNFGWEEAPDNDLSLVKPRGILSDVAPTILHLLNIPKPEEMIGNTLIK
jgi:2,3-bisphosphoglycerate-independent phosphoglycerate mutase